MKKLLLLTLLLAMSASGFSQGQKQKLKFIPEHEFRIGIGAWPLMYDLDYFDYHYDIAPFRSGNKSLTYDKGLIYSGPEYITGSISLGYTYNIKKWLSIGGTFSYTGVYRNYLDRVTTTKTGSENTYDFCLTPMLRFTYFNRKYVRFYSQIGLGIAVGRTTMKLNGGKYSLSEFHVSGQASFLGISVGNRLFGFGEIGVGTQGVIVAGIGYRFNPNKKYCCPEKMD